MYAIFTYARCPATDLHAAPGKQNADSHSGQTGPIKFYEPQNLAHTQRVLCVLARELDAKINVVGLQLVNEPQHRSELCGWYTSTIAAIRNITPDLPIYISDGWSTKEFVDFVAARPDFVVVDHHLYRCFNGEDHRLSGDEHAHALDSDAPGLSALTNACRKNFIVGEFSAALNPASLRSNEAGEQDRQRRVFAQAQIKLFDRFASGWYFWTYRKDKWDAGWSLKDATTAAIMPGFVGTKKKAGGKLVPDESARLNAKDHAFGGTSPSLRSSVPLPHAFS